MGNFVSKSLKNVLKFKGPTNPKISSSDNDEKRIWELLSF